MIRHCDTEFSPNMAIPISCISSPYCDETFAYRSGLSQHAKHDHSAEKELNNTIFLQSLRI